MNLYRISYVACAFLFGSLCASEQQAKMAPGAFAFFEQKRLDLLNKQNNTSSAVDVPFFTTITSQEKAVDEKFSESPASIISGGIKKATQKNRKINTAAQKRGYGRFTNYSQPGQEQKLYTKIYCSGEGVEFDPNKVLLMSFKIDKSQKQ